MDDATVTVVVDGRPAGTMPLDKAARLAKDVVSRKLAGKGSPMAERGNEEMFSGKEMGAETAQTIAAGQLRAFIERVERLEEDKAAITEDIRDVYLELKGVGFDVRAVRALVKLRRKDPAERREEEAILDLYKAALGMA
jgi:uncharacterized protein (UPF0335 family)